jgi:Zn-dependent protease
MMVSVTFSLNLVLGCFNLLPLPPLDGATAIGLLLSEDAMRRWRGMMSQPHVAMAGLMVAWFTFGHLFSPVFTLALNTLYPGSHYH